MAFGEQLGPRKKEKENHLGLYLLTFPKCLMQEDGII